MCFDDCKSVKTKVFNDLIAITEITTELHSCKKLKMEE